MRRSNLCLTCFGSIPNSLCLPSHHTTLSGRCDATQDHALAAIYQLSATVWQWMSWHLPALLSNNVETVHTCGNLIYDFAECQLGKVSASNAVGLGAAGRDDQRSPLNFPDVAISMDDVSCLRYFCYYYDSLLFTLKMTFNRRSFHSFHD